MQGLLDFLIRQTIAATLVAYCRHISAFTLGVGACVCVCVCVGGFPGTKLPLSPLQRGSAERRDGRSAGRGRGGGGGGERCFVETNSSVPPSRKWDKVVFLRHLQLNATGFAAGSSDCSNNVVASTGSPIKIAQLKLT